MGDRDIKSPSARGHEKWKGNNTFCFEGRVIGGPQTDRLARTIFLIVMPTVVFCCITASELWSQHRFPYPLIAASILGITSIICLLKTAFTDPGIIPRSNVVISRPRKHRRQHINITGKVVEFKWCQTCRIFRPPRAFHCPICNNCVERFDHHCPWIGNCIGARNYGSFSSFLWFTDILCVLVLASCLRLLVLTARLKDGSKWEKAKYALEKKWPTVAIAFFVFLIMWFVIGLTAFHVYLVCLNKTTNEKLRNIDPHGSPYSLGLKGNIAALCCTIPESNVHIHHLEPTTSANEYYIRKTIVKRFVPTISEEPIHRIDPKGGSDYELPTPQPLRHELEEWSEDQTIGVDI